jgi:hypothetical protein
VQSRATSGSATKTATVSRPGRRRSWPTGCSARSPAATTKRPPPAVTTETGTPDQALAQQVLGRDPRAAAQLRVLLAQIATTVVGQAARRAGVDGIPRLVRGRGGRRAQALGLAKSAFVSSAGGAGRRGGGHVRHRTGGRADPLIIVRLRDNCQHADGVGRPPLPMVRQCQRQLHHERAPSCTSSALCGRRATRLLTHNGLGS